MPHQSPVVMPSGGQMSGGGSGHQSIDAGGSEAGAMAEIPLSGEVADAGGQSGAGGMVMVMRGLRGYAVFLGPSNRHSVLPRRRRRLAVWARCDPQRNSARDGQRL